MIYISTCIFGFGIILFYLQVPDPVHLTDTIMRDLADKKQLKARFLLRMIPIEVTCGVDTERNLVSRVEFPLRYNFLYCRLTWTEYLKRLHL